MSGPDLINIGLSEAGNDKLDRLKEMGYFAEKMDGYRFAVSLALAQGVIPPDITKRTTFLNVGSLDPDQTLRRIAKRFALYSRQFMPQRCRRGDNRRSG